MIGNDFDTPIMYQDLANSTMGSIQTPFTARNYFPGGNVSLRRQVDADTVEIMNKKSSEDKSTAKKALIAIGVLLAVGFIPVVRKGIKDSGGVFKYIKSLFKKTPQVPPTPQKPPFTQRAKAWCSAKWEAFKKIFKRNKP